MNPNREQIESQKSGRWYKFFLNKYLIVTILFVVWMVFFDQNSYFIHKELNQEIRDLTKAKKLYLEKLEKETIQIHQMKTNASEIERIAREKHYLRKENEDVFIIEKQIVKKSETDESTAQ